MANRYSQFFPSDLIRFFIPAGLFDTEVVRGKCGGNHLDQMKFALWKVYHFQAGEYKEKRLISIPMTPRSSWLRSIKL